MHSMIFLKQEGQSRAGKEEIMGRGKDQLCHLHDINAKQLYAKYLPQNVCVAH
jgi:hypothetical protein